MASAPPTLRVLGWNIENYGRSKHRHGSGVALVEFIATVISEYRYDVVAICEIRSRLGAVIGKDLADELNNMLNSSGAWSFEASAPFCDDRQEQYLFLWDGSKFAKKPTFTATFKDPSGQKTLGFPKQVAKNRPPFMGVFETKIQTIVRIAMMHSAAPSKVKEVRGAGKNLALIDGFREPGISVLIGDFNVKADANAKTGDQGQAAFADLVGGCKFEQLFADHMATSLVKSGWVGMTKDQCVSSPYDQIFLKGLDQSKKLVAVLDPLIGPGMEHLVEDCVGPVKQDPLKKALARLYFLGFAGGSAPSSFTMELAFQTYRALVSDHFPVGADLVVN